MIFYSANTGGFYASTVNVFIPEDAVEITTEQHLALLDGPARGMRIVADSTGFPVLADPLPLSSDVLEANERSWRSEQLTMTDGVVTRHRDEIEEGGGTTLTAEQYVDLQLYRRALRDWPQGDQFPLSEHRPVAPEWLVGLVE